MMEGQSLKDPKPIDPLWYVVLTSPQQDITAVWNMHQLGLELFVPVIRRKVKTGRKGRDGRPVTRIIPKPMFPGYGFLRTIGAPDDLGRVKGVRGVREFMRDDMMRPVTLPEPAIMAIFTKQNEKHQEWLAEGRNRRFVPYKRGDRVRLDVDTGAYAGLVATVDKVDGRGRVAILLGMIRHWMPADKVVAA